ncbi:uncharacterized protein LTR77_009604 [Saxophila tyrrhenica]|uniref:Uncharacterized protein n=1 Tax=Saxophila tyrrhenica TaxID=1690608 RepID=A0AAV9P1I7_9PEZI|nr:hypothetical protein LTR77_009604 [Saxophila tyrrhenica]
MTKQPPTHTRKKSTTSASLHQPIHRLEIMSLPFSSHPLFKLRRASIIIALIGIFLCVCSFKPWSDGSLVGAALILAISALCCAADLLRYAIKKVENPDQDPLWPQRKWMLADGVLAVVLQFTFWAAASDLSYSGDDIVVAAYGVLGALLCSLLHAWCLWKEITARYKKKWLAELERTPCSQCGHTESIAQAAQASHGFYDAESARPFLPTREPMMTPESVASTLEEGLLIGSDYNGYGSIDPVEPTLVQPEEVIVGKGKKSKKSAASSSKNVEK